MDVATRLFLICHAPLASSFHGVACHAFGQRLNDAVAIDVLSHQSREQVAALIEEAWVAAGSPAQVLLLTDLMGATPCNGASLWMDKKKESLEIAGIAGMSLPLLLKALTYRQLLPSELAEHLLRSQADCGCRLEVLSTRVPLQHQQ
jgi:PTS system ascorbate-specific IIA component